MDSNFTDAQIKEITNIVLHHYQFEILCELIGGAIGIAFAVLFT